MFADFFDPLVGTPEATENTRAWLVQAVREGLDTVEVSDPYDRLRLGLMVLVDRYISSRPLAVRQGYKPDSLAHNIGLGGVHMTINALKRVGSLYAQHVRGAQGAPVPQRRAGVERSVAHTLGLIWSLANRDMDSAAISVEALRVGGNPRNKTRQMISRFRTSRRGKLEITMAKTFAATRDKDGQVSIVPRHRPMEATSEDHCPAVDERTLAGDKSLWRYLHLVGEVAITEIFARQFPIVEDGESIERVHDVGRTQ